MTPGTPNPRLSYDPAALAALCRRHGVRSLALFGSVLRDDFRAESDVDVLVEFESGRTPGLDFIALQEALAGLFGGRRVDLVTRKSLHPRIRERVLASAAIAYAA
ncbi:MAG: nucleotidyltransferase family protein [Polyangiaceae bacterium]